MNNFPRLTAVVLRLAVVIGVVVILYYGKGILTLLTVAGLIAMLLNPIDNKLRSWGWSKGLAITGAMFVLLLFFAGLFFAVGKQASRFVDNWPKIESRLTEQIAKARQQIPFLPSGGAASDSTATGITAGGGSGGGEDILGSLPVRGSQITGAVSGTLSILGDFLLMLVYVVLLLSQKERLREFVLRRASAGQRQVADRTIDETTDVAQQYLKGRLILILILSVLYSIGFSISGLQYAIVISVLVAFLSIIPYLGNIIGGVIAIAIAVASGGGTDVVLGILITMTVAQILESYVLTPLIVGDEVDINPLTTIVGVIAFTLLWGPVGAIVAIPVIAICRVIFQHVKGLHDYAYLLGQE